MSLYNESEKALAELNDVIASVKDAKGKLNKSADKMSEALHGFITLNKPLYTIVENDLELDKVVKSSSDELRSEVAALKGALLRDLEKSVEQVRSSSESFNSSLLKLHDSLENEIRSVKAGQENSEAKISKQLTLVMLLTLINMGSIGFVLFKLLP